MKKSLILLRGLPGAGKSTLAKSISNYTCEADYYFRVKKDQDGNVIKRAYLGFDGEYEFEPGQIKDAHQFCRNRCESFMENEVEKVVVSNTFTREWEMEEYYKLAEKYNYIVHSVIVENRHGGVNTHGVPKETLDKMANRFEVKLG